MAAAALGSLQLRGSPQTEAAAALGSLQLRGSPQTEAAAALRTLQLCGDRPHTPGLRQRPSAWALSRTAMARIELWMTVFAGVSGGLAGVLWSGFVTTPWLARGPGETSPEPAARLLAGAVLRAAAGALLGFMFWLGWGLIAVVGLPWYATGSLYGGLCWTALVAPALGTLQLHGRGATGALAAHALEWLVTCLAIGLLCALSWHRYA